jgi:hypothetical protein
VPDVHREGLIAHTSADAAATSGRTRALESPVIAITCRLGGGLAAIMA